MTEHHNANRMVAAAAPLERAMFLFNPGGLSSPELPASLFPHHLGRAELR
jgi:hypothetical protein